MSARLFERRVSRGLLGDFLGHTLVFVLADRSMLEEVVVEVVQPEFLDGGSLGRAAEIIFTHESTSLFWFQSYFLPFSRRIFGICAHVQFFSASISRKPRFSACIYHFVHILLLNSGRGYCIIFLERIAYNFRLNDSGKG